MSFAPDLGLRYLDAGHADRVIRINRAPIHELVQIGPKALTCTVNIDMEVRYAMSLDFEGAIVDELLARTPLGDAVRIIINLPFDAPRKIELPPIRADLETRLGSLEDNANERYVPFKVQSIAPPSAMMSFVVT
jgi:hypothetical protein